jgi:S1-C subfamily serine protease
MKRNTRSFALALVLASLFAPTCLGDDAPDSIVKRGGNTVSLELKFVRKQATSFQRFVSALDYGPNGFATGFHVADGLVMTAYHVVSGDVSISKKAMLGFGPRDALEVKVYVNGCQARVVKIDEAADLALLSVCQSSRENASVTFQPSLDKDEKLLLIARPHGGKMVRRGTFHGPYMSRGMQYWSAKIDSRDGYSGSPVYNYRAEVVGVFSGYDPSNKLGLISPGSSAQKLLEDYKASAKP